MIKTVLDNPNESIGLINKTIPKPENDFKGRVIDGEVKEVGINIFDDNCFAFQPLYKLSKKDIFSWWNNVAKFISNGINGCYAENALNEITNEVHIKAMQYDDYFIDEIDNPQDYERVTSKIRLFDFDEQEIITSLDFIKDLNNPLIVVDEFLKDKFSQYKTFSDFKPNPVYEDVLKGIEIFKDCDCIVSIGGGSAIDVAKAIKYFTCLNEKGEFIYKNIKHYAIPTTAGTGSESTRYAVIYKDGVKQSLTHDAIYPDVAVLVPSLLETLPLYQKKCTLLDALCHSIESIWSINATEQSAKYAQEAIELIKANYKEYLNGNNVIISSIQKAANLAGKAINISQTTAAHALSYKITSLYKIPHGYAVALTLPILWKNLINHNICLENENITLEEFYEIFNYMNLANKIKISDEELQILTKSVNVIRLGNYPIQLDEKDIKNVYSQIREK